MIGRTISHYRIESKLGEGGMGVVYKAVDVRLDRPVALKVLPPEAVADPERKKRFVQEAKAASALNHPNIVTIYEIGTADGVDFIAMEFVPGKTLEDWIGCELLGLAQVLKCSVQMADALAKAHTIGIVHRDLKPANIMVTNEGLVKLLDFGLAKLIEHDVHSEFTASTRSPRTEKGTIIGTVAYMSPEQAEAKDVDTRSDVFSFGSVLYEMATGRRAFQGETKISTLSAILHQEPQPATTVAEGVPRELEKIITRCLRKDPDRRIQHMIDVKLALQEPIYGTPPRPGLNTGAFAKLCEDCGQHISWSSDDTKILYNRGEPSGVYSLDIFSGRSRLLVADPQYNLYEPYFSPDSRWITFNAVTAHRSRIYIAQFSDGRPVPASEWIAITNGEPWDDNPRWSPDGNTLYFTAEGDGFRCISAQRLEPATKRPKGPPIAIYHSHHARRSLLNVELRPLKISVARDKIVFTMSERTGNIWMTKLQGR